MALNLPAPSGLAEIDAVLALHGSACTGHQWRALANSLMGLAEVIAPDLPGYGESANDRMCRLARLRQLLEDVGRPVHVVGHSLGGALAMRLAGEVPDLVKSLTLYDPLVVQHGVLPQELSGAWRRYGACCKSELMRAFLDFWGGAGCWDGLSAKQRERLISLAPTLGRDFAEIEAGLWDIQNEAYQGPIIAMWGSNSPSATIDMAQQMTKAFTQVEHLWLAGHGHLAPLTHPDCVATYINKCLTAATVHTGSTSPRGALPAAA